MATLIIPMFDAPAYTEEVTLEGVPYRLDFAWNSRGGFWSLSFATRDQVPLVSGIKLVLNYELIRNHPDRGLPAGSLWAIDASGKEEPIGYSDFVNGRCQLVYVDTAGVE